MILKLQAYIFLFNKNRVTFPIDKVNLDLFNERLLCINVSKKYVA